MSGAKTVYLVTTNGTLQGIFEQKQHADDFAAKFTKAVVESETLFTEPPKFFRYECCLALETGEVVSLKEIEPSFDKLLLRLDKTTLLAVGETPEEATESARAYRAKLLAQ